MDSLNLNEQVICSYLIPLPSYYSVTSKAEQYSERENTERMVKERKDEVKWEGRRNEARGCRHISLTETVAAEMYSTSPSQKINKCPTNITYVYYNNEGINIEKSVKDREKVAVGSAF